MKLYQRLVLSLMVLALTGAPVLVHAQEIPDIAKIKDDLDEVAGDFARGLAFNAALGLWSDAYIGNITDAPPHFGVGINAGATTIKSKGLTSLLNELGEGDSDFTDLLDDLGLPLPAGLLSARIGGAVLPFDVGIRGMYLSDLSLGEISLTYAVFGLDVRYALLKDQGILPGLSLGLGYTYVGGGVGLSIGEDQSITFGSTRVEFTKPKVDIAWGSSTLDLKLQVSKRLFIFTPFLGLGASYGLSTVDFGIKSESTVPESIKEIAEQYGFDLGDQEVTSSTEEAGFAFRIYGGTSLDIAFIRINLGVLYSPTGNNLGADFGLRFQL